MQESKQEVIRVVSFVQKGRQSAGGISVMRNYGIFLWENMGIIFTVNIQTPALLVILFIKLEQALFTAYCWNSVDPCQSLDLGLYCLLMSHLLLYTHLN